jgi:uncharacterized protein (TIGR03435 family)
MNTAAVLSLAVPLALAAAQLPGQTPAGPPVDPATRFEVVSIKPFDAPGGAQPRMSVTPGRYDVAGMPLSAIIGQALLLPPNRIFGLPAWVDTARYTIAAKAPDGPSAARAMFVMLANLLKDRFNMVTHPETREMPVYHLVFAREDRRFGPSLKETSVDCRAALAARLDAVARGEPVPAAAAGADGCGQMRVNVGTASFSGVTAAGIAGALTPFAGRTVIDKTGLAGAYDFALTWSTAAGNPAPFGLPLGGPGPPAAPPPPADPDAPDLFTAVQEQLGLKLESARGPVPVMVVDRIEKPALD